MIDDDVLSELRALRARVEELEARLAAAETTAERSVLDGRTSRRGLLAAAAGGAAFLVAGAEPAAAASGSLQFGLDTSTDNQAGVDRTRLTTNPPSGAGFVVETSNKYAASSSGRHAAIAAFANSNGDAPVGMYGYTEKGGVNGRGVIGISASSAGDFAAGVHGLAGGAGQAGVRAEGVVDGAMGLDVVADSDSGTAARIENLSDGINSIGLTVEAGRFAIRGTSTVSPGVGVQGYGQAQNGYGGWFEAGVGGVGVLCGGGRAAITINPPIGGQLDPRTDGALHGRGEILLDTVANTLWYVHTNGPNLVRLAGTDTAGQLTFHPAPVRAYDSRAGQAPLGVAKGKLGNGATRVIDLKVNGALPARCQAALVNLTITNTEGSGFLRLYRNGEAVPSSSSINWQQPGQNLANTTAVAVDALGRVQVNAIAGAANRTDVVIDVIGYWY